LCIAPSGRRESDADLRAVPDSADAAHRRDRPQPRSVVSSSAFPPGTERQPGDRPLFDSVTPASSSIPTCPENSRKVARAARVCPGLRKMLEFQDYYARYTFTLPIAYFIFLGGNRLMAQSATRNPVPDPSLREG